MDSTERDDKALESLFGAARSKQPEPNPDFLARLNSDALAAVPRPVAVHPAQKNALFSRLKTLFAASGLSGAAALGVWIGFVMPDLLTPLSVVADDTSGISAFLTEGDLLVLSE